MPWASQLMRCVATRHQDRVSTELPLEMASDPYLVVSMLETPSLNSFARFVSAIVPCTIVVSHRAPLRSHLWHITLLTQQFPLFCYAM